MSPRYVQSRRCAFTTIEGKAIVVTPKERMLHVMDEVGSDIWAFIDQPRSLDEVASHVVDRYDVTPEAARRDAEEFLAELVAKRAAEKV